MKEKRGLPSLTGIRGIAALWVMSYHAQQSAARYFGLPFLEKIPLFNDGWSGVDLFFILSGFILMYSHGNDFVCFDKDRFIRFAKLRFVRVYPLNAAILFLIAIIVPFQHEYVAWIRRTNPFDYTFGAFIRTLLLATRWHLPGRGDWNQPVWSLSYEIIGYILFPLLAFCVLRVKRKWQLAGIALVSLLGYLAVFYLNDVTYSNVISGKIAFYRMLSCYVTGIVTYRLWVLTSPGWNKLAARITAVSFSGILVFSFIQWGRAFYLFLFAVLIYGLAFQHGLVSRVFSSRISMFFGRISFPLYLIHLFPLMWLRYFLSMNAAKYSLPQRSLFMMLWVLVCILMAATLHFTIEKPFHDLGRRWASPSRLQ